jgi:hypothetical protein
VESAICFGRVALGMLKHNVEWAWGVDVDHGERGRRGRPED